MPVCAVCDDETFNEVDGLYYCEMCGTQSQEMRDEQVGDNNTPEANSRLRLTQKRRKEKLGSEDKGKPWVIWEAYQFIIKAQVEALIKLGVNGKLKDIVRKIWFKYLQCTGIAFTNDSVITNTSVDKHIGQTPRKIKEKKCKATQEQFDEELELCSQISKEEFYQDDDPHGVGPSSESGSSDDSETETIGSVPLGQRQKRHHMKVRRLLAFPYLGLLWMKEPVFLSDLLRWVRDGHLPYHNVAEILPGFMKLRDLDHKYLYQDYPVRREYILNTAYHIVKTVGLSELPGLDLRVYTSRFILDLHLPATALDILSSSLAFSPAALLHGFVNKLLQIYTARTGFYANKNEKLKLPLNEENAMAYIMIAMKLCYGLNDSDEKKQVSLAEQAPEQSPTGSLPIFEEWLGDFRRCAAERAKDGVPWTQEEMGLLREPANYSTFCKTNIFGKWVEPDLALTQERKRWRTIRPLHRALSEENREKRSQLFRTLAKSDGCGVAEGERVPSSFPRTCRHIADEAGTPQRSPPSGQKCYETSSARGIPVEELRGGDGVQSARYFFNLKDKDALSSVHSSYRAVLYLIASRIECEPELLHRRVKTLELIIFSSEFDEESVGPRSNRKWKIMRKYF